VSEALTFAFADEDADVCGVARLGRTDSGESGLVVVFRGGDVASVSADGAGHAGLTVEDAGADRWSVRFDGDVPFELEFEAEGAPLVLGADTEVGHAGGMEGSDRICRVTGTVGGEAFAGRGQRGESSGDPDWERMTTARTLTAWFEDGFAISGVAIRPADAESHAEELAAVFVAEDEPGLVADPRISTTYDDEERQRSAGLELWVREEDEYPMRVAGELACGTSLDLGRLRLDCAFFRWRTHGRSGVGRYDILKRVA
jgi:hypothetical protein